MPRPQRPAHLLGLILLVGVGLPARAQSGPAVHLQVRAQPAEVRRGERLVYEVEVATADPGWIPQEPVLPPLATALLTVLDRRTDVHRLSQEDLTITRLRTRVHLRADRPGRFTFGPARVTLRDAQGGSDWRVASDPLTVVIRPAPRYVIPRLRSTPRDVRPRLPGWLLMALAAAAGLAVGIARRRRGRRLPPRDLPAAAPPPGPPFPLTPGSAPRAARTLREEAGRRYPIEAKGLTSTEVIAALQRQGAASSLRDDLATVLEWCDGARFGSRGSPSASPPAAAWARIWDRWQGCG